MEPGRDRFPKTGIFCLTWASNFELPTKKCFLGRRRLAIPYTWGLLQKCHDKMMHSGFFSKICLTFPKISTRYARKCDGNFRAIKAATQGFEMSLRSFVLKMFNTSYLRIRTLEWFFIEGHSSMFFVVKIEMMVVCSTFLFLWRGTSTWQTFILLVCTLGCFFQQNLPNSLTSEMKQTMPKMARFFWIEGLKFDVLDPDDLKFRNGKHHSFQNHPNVR